MSDMPKAKWPYEVWGKESNEGWSKLVDPLIEQAEKEGADILQIKEKFGGLRFYVSGPSELLRQMIDTAELLSYKTCESCGAPGEMRNSTYWLKTLCDACDMQRLQHLGKPSVEPQNAT